MSSRNRSRSRSPINNFNDHSRALFLTNLPRSWDFDQVKQFIKQNSKGGRDLRFVDIIKYQGKNSGSCIAKFAHINGATDAINDLDGIQVEGRTISVKLHDGANTYKQSNQRHPHPSQNSNKYAKNKQQEQPAQENHETYGLSISFLKSLGIAPPLTNKVFVYNLDDRVDEKKIQEVFGMAGQIVNFIFTKKDESQQKKEHMQVTAKIEYDHPVEAVQAIAMFHNQELYERKILMRLDYMIKGPLRKMPVGLKGMGPALGASGEPMRNVRQFLEIQSLRQELNDKLMAKTSNNQNNANPNMVGNNTMNQMIPANQIANTNLGNQIPNETVALQNQLVNNLNANAFNTGLGLNPMLLNQNMNNLQAFSGLVQNNAMVPNQLNTAQINAWKDNQGLVNQGMLNQGMVNQPMLNQAMVNQSMVNQPMVNQTLVNQQLANQAMVNQSNMLQGNLSNLNNNHGQDYSGGSSSSWSQQQSFDRRGGDGDKVFADDNMDLSDSRREEDDRRQGTNSEMLVFNYLPPSVSLATLQQKMREIGEIKFIEMTGQGRAIVRFKSFREAEHCIKMYDRSRVDGQLIEVKYF